MRERLFSAREFVYGDSMLTEYIQAAMRGAHYELMENGRIFGKIPACRGGWAQGGTLEECREELRTTLEGWLLLGHRIPVIDGLNLNPARRRRTAEHA